MNKAQSCVLLIDGGGSGARARLCTLDGTILATGKGGPANLSSDYAGASQNLHALAELVYAQAGRDQSLMAADFAFVALAGAGASAQRQELIDSFSFQNMTLATDIDVTLAAALGTEQDGVVAMLGTGSFYVWRSQGEVRRVGGWGMHLGDECGGAWLGRELLREAVKAYDKVGIQSPLTAQLIEEFGGSPKAMVPFARDAQAADYAKLAPRLVAAYEQGDSVATAIINRALEMLCATLGPADQLPGQRLCFLGGLGPFYQNHMPADYQAICRSAAGEALDGAFWLAQREFGF
ncbi:BadF/BadG/BcrA/BcrD ATPase family protein [Maritalea sp. S77]|uniref:BadF/BadG/BcrA/BcrD ATPase family protein n=1 Tax=Maritalea sp. S77 TaxID=3415125 RepID=UPI003C7D71B1